MSYRSIVSSIKNPPVSESLDTRQVKNYSGGYVYKVQPLDMLRRFLILGSDKNTYHVGARELTKANIGNLDSIIKATDGIQVVDLIQSVSVSGAAPRNDHALFALAYVAATGNLETKERSYTVLQSIARTGSDLFKFIEYSDLFRGWGTGFKKAIANWYLGKSVDDMAYQMVKYQSRTQTEGKPGYSQGDVLRLAHPYPDSPMRSNAFGWSLGKYIDGPLPDIMQVYDTVKKATSEKEVIQLIKDHGLTHEFVPASWHGSSKVWEALLPNLPPMAMLRNLGRLSHLGVLSGFSELNTVRSILNDEKRIVRSRLHPLDCLNALMVYRAGHGIRGSLSWSPVGKVTDIITDAFYMSFGSIKPTGKNIMIALDVSGSMTWVKVANMELTPRDVCAVMSMVYLRTEPNVIVTAFSNGIKTLDMSKNDSLDSVIGLMNRQNASSTDCSLPMQYAKTEKLDADAFIIFTDNETNSGNHPMMELRNYRKALGKPNAGLIVNATLPSPFTIADPDDLFTLDVVGFDSTVPMVVSEVLSRS